MKLHISSTILETALRGILESEEYTLSIDKRELDEDNVGDIFIDKDPSGGLDEEDSESEEESTEDMTIERQEDKFETKKEAYEALSETTKKVVDNKAKEHNDEVGSDRSKRTTPPTLAMVYWRGIGAYNTNPESVRPTVTSAEQWAIARINSFLYALKNGKYRSGKHDTDLLPKNHPMSSTDRSIFRSLLDPDNALSPQELDMLITQLGSIEINANNIKSIVEEYGHAPAWAESKINSISDTLAKLESYMTAEVSRAVGDVDPTNYPKQGDDKKVSLQNSEYPIFDRVFVERIKNEYPSIWDRGGNILGNKQYTRLSKVLDQNGVVDSETDEEAIRLREAWAARHFEDFRLAGVVAQMKWFVIGSKGEKYMKDLIREEIKKIEDKKERNMSNEKLEFRCISEVNNDSHKVYKLEGRDRIQFGMNDINVRAFDENDEEIDVEESLRAINGRGRPAKYYSIEGIASSTSIDTYGTEMSYNALLEMQDQMTKGIPLLPRHTSRANGGMAEWDEVIGRTYEADIRQDDVLSPANDRDKQYSLLVRSRLYGEDTISRELVKRLRRGEPIGQSIGGWFNDMEIIENIEGEIERVIIKSVTLDHLAITRAPANPDSVGLATYSKDSKTIQNILTNWRSQMEQKTTLEQVEPTSEERTKDPSKIENRHISDMEETEDKYIITFDKAMMNMAGHEDMHEKMEEYMKEYMQDEKMQEYMKEMLEKKMQEYMEEMIENSKMEFDELAKSEPTEDLEKRELDHNSVVEEPVLDDVGIEGGGDISPPQPEEIENSPFGKMEDRDVMEFHDDLPLAAEDVPFEWNTTTQDEVLGEGLDNWDRYAMAHLYKDSDANPETKGAYKLPIALMINGELRVVWNGIRAAMGALNGARGGVDISDEDREKIYNVLSQYYAKFEKDIPELRVNDEENQKENLIKENNVILSTENQKESSMNNEDMKNLAELIGRSISEGMKPLTERIEKLESRSNSTMNETTEKEKEVNETLPTDVQELRSIIEKQNDLIARALQEPQRTGLVSGQVHRGIGATTAIERLVERSAKEGYVSLSAIVKRHAELLSEETNLNKVSVHVLKDLLSSGLRSAEQDGLLGNVESSWS